MLGGTQLSFLEAVAPENARYKAVATISADALFLQEFHLAKDVPAALEKHLPTQKNTYLSLCDYQRPKRAGEALFGFSAFGFDIDCHASADPGTDAQKTYEHLHKHLFGTQAFPMPTMVTHTGRGLLVVIAFARAPKQVLPLWLRMGEGFAARIREALPPYAKLDDTYQDVARVVRVPESYNTRSGTYAKALHCGEVEHELSELKARFFPELQRNKAAKPTRTANIIFTDQHIKLHQDRLDDLIQLLELRQYRVDGLREIILFLYRYWTCFYLAPQGALAAALELNQCFARPLTPSEVTRATRSAETAFERWKVDKQSGYNYRNDTLIKLLCITEAEQAQLKTIISKAEKARRRSEKKQWGNEKRDRTRQNHKQSRKEAITNAICLGLSVRDICRTYNCSPNTVRALSEALQRYHFGRSTYYLSAPRGRIRPVYGTLLRSLFRQQLS